MKTFEGKLVSENIKVGIVAARFNEFITSKLVSGALDGLKRENVQEDDIDVAWVPGAFEIPLIASKMAKSRKYDAIICVGAVSVEAQAITITCAMKCRKESPRSALQMIFRLCLGYSQRIRSNRQSNVQEQKLGIKVLNAPRVRLKW